MVEQLQETGSFFIPSVRELYEFALTPNQRLEFQQALKGVRRWHDPVYSYLVGENVRQTNLGHTNGMLIAAELSLSIFTHLAEKINQDQLQIMIAEHDIPEFGTKDKNGFDVASSERDTPIGQRRKRLESPTFYRSFLPEVQDPLAREYLGKLYARFIRQDPDDIDALLARFLDKFEAGVVFSGQHIFNYKAHGLEVTDRVKKHMEEITLGRMIEPAVQLTQTLTGKAQSEMVELTRAGILRIMDIGYPVEAQKVLDQFNSQIPASIRKSRVSSGITDIITCSLPQNY